MNTRQMKISGVWIERINTLVEFEEQLLRPNQRAVCGKN
jgi:hypothetical protein